MKDEIVNQLIDALQVLVLTPHVRAYLQQQDPMGLKQAEAALTAADWNFPTWLEEHQEFLTGTPKLDPPKGLKGRDLILFQIAAQKRWITGCEANGVSYTGENGDAIRQADREALVQLERRLR